MTGNYSIVGGELVLPDGEVLDRCPGLFCGRRELSDNSSCGSCPWGTRTNGFVCEPCDASPSTYEALFLAVVLFIVFALNLHALGQNQRHKKSNSDLVLALCVMVEITLAILFALLASPPQGSLSIVSCRMSALADWYPALHNPTVGHIHTLHCASEAAFPLTTFVLLVHAFSAALAIGLRFPISHFWLEDDGAPSIYETLYGLPLLSIAHVVLGGLFFYAYPYFLVVLAAIITFVSLTVKASHNSLYNKPVKADIILWVFMYILKFISLLALAHFFSLADGTHWAFVLLGPMVPPLWFSVTKRFTDPDRYR